MNLLNPFLFTFALSMVLYPTSTLAVTCATGIPASNPDTTYIDNGNGTVTHTPTNLTWKRCIEGTTWSGGKCVGKATSHSWSQALTLATNSNFSGAGDWRLPNIKELRSLVEECRNQPSINDTIFPSYQSEEVWSGSPDWGHAGAAWKVSFVDGDAGSSFNRNWDSAVRLVRGGEVSAPSCTLVAEPEVYSFDPTPTGLWKLTAICGLAATSHSWGDAECINAPDNTDSTCTVAPRVDTTYSVVGKNAHGTSASATVKVTVNGSQRYALSVSVSGAGTISHGAWTCTSGNCVEQDVSGSVTLIAAPEPGFRTEWSGACSAATGDACTISVDSDMTVAVVFKPSMFVKPIYPKTSTEVSEVMQGGNVTRWYSLETGSGLPWVQTEVRYRITGEVVDKTALTDADGLFAITTDAQAILSSDKTKVQKKVVNFEGVGSQDFGVTVATRSLEQTWLMEASLKGEIGLGPAVGVSASIAGFGPKFAAGWSVGFGLGGTYGISVTHKANMADVGYLYTASALLPNNHALSASQTLGLESSINAKSDYGVGIKTVAPKKFVGLDLSAGVELKGTARWGASALFPSYFDPVQPTGPCHLGWQVTSQIFAPLLTGAVAAVGVSPTEFICGTPLAGYLSESTQSTSIGGTISGGATVGFSGYTAAGENAGYQQLRNLSLKGGIEGAFQVGGISTQRYKGGAATDREQSIELLYGYKRALDAGGSLKTLHGVLGETFKGKLDLKDVDGTERRVARTEVFSTSGAWKAARMEVTASSSGSLASGSISGGVQVDTNTTIETDNEKDWAALPGFSLVNWSLLNPSTIDKALADVLSPTAAATESPLKLGVETERFFQVIDIGFDLGAAFGLKLKTSAGVKLSPSERFQTGVAKIANVDLRGKNKRIKFNTESYVDDQYLVEQRKSPTSVASQMQLAISNFSSKILTSAKAVANQAGEVVVATAKAAVDKVSEVSGKALKAGVELYLTVERWTEGTKPLSSPIYSARSIATTDTEAVVGPLHFVNVKTETGLELDELPSGATLKIGQVSQYLSAANLAATSIKDVRVYRVDFDTATKTLVGGTYQQSTDQLIVDLTRTGAYIMVVDTKAPTINSDLVVNLDSATGNLRVSALLDQDATGINSASITLSVNGVNVLTNVTATSYFNAAANNFGYLVPKAYLKTGNNDVQFRVADGAGNIRMALAQVYVTPAILTIPPVTSAGSGASVVSAPISVVGPTIPVTVNVINGEYRINGGAWTSSAGAVKDGDVVVVRVVASNTPGDVVRATLTIAGVGSGSFVVTTASIPEPSAQPTGKLVNISTRAYVGTGDDVLIVGFIISGGPKRLVIMAEGPSLTTLGVNGVLTDPKLTLYSGSTVLQTNESYLDSTDIATLQTLGVVPKHNLEAAIVATLQPGWYTAIVSGSYGATGIALVSVTDMDDIASASRLINISSRARAATSGDEQVIAGFIVKGGKNELLFKGEGPSLSTFGVGGAMPNPAITAMSGSTAIASSDDWVNEPGASVISASGIAPKNNLEAAMVATLAEGAYTVIMRGVGSGGVGIIAVNELAAAAQLQSVGGESVQALAENAFSVVESLYRTELGAPDGQSQSKAGYRYRTYSGAHVLAVNEAGTPHLFYMGPLSGGLLVDLGELGSWVGSVRTFMQ